MASEVFSEDELYLSGVLRQYLVLQGNTCFALTQNGFKDEFYPVKSLFTTNHQSKAKLSVAFCFTIAGLFNW